MNAHPSLFSEPEPEKAPAKTSKSVAAIVKRATKAFEALKDLGEADSVEAINQIRIALSDLSPFKAEPVDCVLWVRNGSVHSNSYNPNAVAPPEMELLRLSIAADGYTQPIVTNPTEGLYEVVDGFHRNRVGKECEDIKARVRGYLPIVRINAEQSDKGDRMASTIRHNRARGKHRVDAMSEIVVDLKRRNWSNEKIGKNLGMDPDEVLRLSQISGLKEMFSDREFSKAWEVNTAFGDAPVNENPEQDSDELGSEVDGTL